MEQKILSEKINKGDIPHLLLLHGDEPFLIDHYAGEIQKKLAADTSVFDETASYSDIIMAAETISFFSAARLIIIKQSGLFSGKRKEDAEEFEKNLKIFDSHIVFLESNVDKRTKFYKKFQAIGQIVACETPKDLTTWVMRHIKISKSNAAYFLRYVGNDMYTVFNEMHKLAAYCAFGEARIEDINAICTQALEARIFDLTKATARKQTNTAVSEYQRILDTKESPHVVLAMIIRQVRLMLLCKAGVEKGLSRVQIAKDLKLRDFMVSEALSLGEQYSTDQLIEALHKCQDMDLRLKTSRMDSETGVLLLIGNLFDKGGVLD